MSRPWVSGAGVCARGEGRLRLLGVSEWGGGPCLSRLGSGRGVGGASGALVGLCFSVRATSHRLAPPGKGPRPTPTPPRPGAASTIPLICNDFCLFPSFSFSDRPHPPPAASMRRHRPSPSGSVRFRFVC